MAAAPRGGRARMNIGWIDAERRGAAQNPGRELPDEQSGRQWQKQLDAELASHSVCRAIQFDGEAFPAAEPPAEDRGGAAAAKTASGDAAPFPAGGNAQAADVGADVPAKAALTPGGPVAADEGAPAAAYGLSLAPAEQAGREGESGTAARAALASDAEAMLRSWLKPCKITVFADQGQLRVWVRDARMDAGEAEALGQRLERHIREKGGRLAMLAVNGAVVYSNAAAGLNVLKQR
ncbi:hypothetical protein [Chromobacterium vaccinii]|uniref:hypothetical protein n=1 Tax=Chromobacterium vaccinii TaxID=1108595 RepID=UPI0031DF5722